MSRALRLLERLRATFWVLPALGITVAIATAFAMPEIDKLINLPDPIVFSGTRDTARASLQIIATVAVSVAGISFSVIVVALVLASQQLSPRVLRSFQRQPLNQAVLGCFLGTAAYSLFALTGLEDSRDGVPELTVTLAMLLAALSLGLFVVFLHHAVRSLNASAVIKRIAEDGHQAVHAPYPEGAGAAPGDEHAALATARELVARSRRRDVRAPRAGYLASVDAAAVLHAADECDGFVEQRCVIGEFALTDALLAVVWCSEQRLDELSARVERSFVLNEERLVDDDVAFPIRQLADVALKGLSPGINDPTTAENAMDSLTDTLVRLARQEPPSTLRVAESGTPRFRAAAPDLDELVRLGFDQVRRDAAGRPSFAVRLLELLDALRDAGGRRAAESRELHRQAVLIRDHATVRADIRADADFVAAAYARLHGERDGVARSLDHSDDGETPAVHRG